MEEHLKTLSIWKDNLHAFAKKYVEPHASQWDHEEIFPEFLVPLMGKIGLLGMGFPASYGGSELDLNHFLETLELFAEYDSSVAATLAAHHQLGVWPIWKYGSQEQKDLYLPLICQKALWAFALTEPHSGSDARATETKATWLPKKNVWEISGHKLWITNSVSEHTLGVTVQAVTGHSPQGPQLSCFLLPIKTPGLTCKVMKGKMMWRATNTGELFLDKVHVPPTHLLGQRGQGFSIMKEALQGGRLSLSAIGLGLSRSVFQAARSYALTRKTFGKVLMEHQAIAFKLADMLSRILASQSLQKEAAQRMGTKDFALWVSVAKLHSAETAEFCAREAQQIFGGYGLMKDSAVEKHFRDAAILRIGEGSNEIQRLIIGRYLCKQDFSQWECGSFYAKDAKLGTPPMTTNL